MYTLVAGAYVYAGRGHLCIRWSRAHMYTLGAGTNVYTGVSSMPFDCSWGWSLAGPAGAGAWGVWMWNTNLAIMIAQKISRPHEVCIF